MSDPFPRPLPGMWPPDYVAIFAWRQRQILKMRGNAVIKHGMLEYYRTRPGEFIEHWLTTYDPRNAEIPLLTEWQASMVDATAGKLTFMPFVMFDRQHDLLKFIYGLLGAQTDGLIEKCRDMGATWECCAISVHIWRFLPGAAVGWGSRKQELVDELGIPDSILEKIRILIRYLPPEFWPVGFDPARHMPFMRIINPETGASITGEVGDNIGRGGRKLIYFKDESAHYERPELIEASLLANTRCQVDISSVNGMNNVFHNKRESGIDWEVGAEFSRSKVNVFVMDWSEHPEKDAAWYERERQKKEDQGLLHVFKQEVDRDYAASIAGTVIKAEWIVAAIDADKVLGFDDEGMNFGALDVADDTPEGDLNAALFRKGPIIKDLDEWGGYDVTKSTQKFVSMGKMHMPCRMQYDSVGMGAGVKGEANRLEDLIGDDQLPDGLLFYPWSAGAKVLFPDKRLILGDKQSPLNGDFFANLKAQGWWQLARRFERTWQAVTKGIVYDPGELISIPSSLPPALFKKLKKELAQVTYSTDTKSAKVVIDKKPAGTKSPNLGDACMMAFWPVGSTLDFYTSKSIG